MISAVDLFCGAGGLTHGLIAGGIPVRAGYDIDPTCKFPYEYNNDSIYINKCVTEINGKEIACHYSDDQIKVLAGCAPCQPFSKYSHGLPKDHKKWSLLNNFSRIINEVKPDIITMENVPQLIKHEIFNDFISNLEKNKYFFSYKIVYCPDYGIPQSRSRLVLIASRFNKISLIPPTHEDDTDGTVRSALENLLPLKAGETDKEDPMHRCRNLSETNLKRIKYSKPGGTWRDWPKSLRANCHNKNSGKTFPSVYGRMKWDKPSPTITTQFFGYGNGRFGHPDQDRALSLREGALLQTFPKKYQFVPNEKYSFQSIGRIIGNAVPVRLGEIIAISIINHLKNVNNFDF